MMIHKTCYQKQCDSLHYFVKTKKTRMWANAQRDGRPAEWVHTAVLTTAVPTTGILTSAT